MRHIKAEAIVCTVRPHGEHGAVARLFTREHGLIAGYVRGARSRTMRPVLQPANRVAMEYRVRSEEQLGSLQLDLVQSRAIHYNEALAASAYSWATLLVGETLPENHAYPHLFDAFAGLVEAVAVAPSARGWAEALVRFEMLLLGELGFGLDLDSCAVTRRTSDLRYVSPKTARAVSGDGAGEYREHLLPLPPFLLDQGVADWPAIFEALELTGFFVERNFFAERRNDCLAARHMLTDRLKRTVA